jgi:hypothetical protein
VPRPAPRRDRPHARLSRNGHLQLTLFETIEHPFVETLRSLTLDEVNPEDALRLLKDWQDEFAVAEAPSIPT